jgi:hypothetical protein
MRRGRGFVMCLCGKSHQGTDRSPRQLPAAEPIVAQLLVQPTHLGCSNNRVQRLLSKEHTLIRVAVDPNQRSPFATRS